MKFELIDFIEPKFKLIIIDLTLFVNRALEWRMDDLWGLISSPY